MSGNTSFKIAIVGLGYVGLPLSNVFLEKGHIVYGIDIDERKVSTLLKHESYLSDFSNEEIKKMFAKGNFFVGSSFKVVEKVDVVIICVPTPLDQEDKPDLTYVRTAITNSIPFFKTGQLVVLESSTYPGTTEEEIVPMVQSTGLIRRERDICCLLT